MASRPVRVVGWVAKSALRIVWISTMVLTPLFGFWLASSLAAYRNASQWLALLVGLLLFPLLPVGWELFFVWRRSKQPPQKAVLTRLDRLVLRTLIINGVFLGGMLWLAPQTAFRAIAVRGDWLLDGHDGPIANGVRSLILDVADHFEQRWHKADDRYGHSDKAPDVTPETTKTPQSGDQPAKQPSWPLPAEPDIAVSEMPESVQTSIDSVGKYLAAHFTDQKRLVKAIHDYVALRLQYDENALAKIMAKDYEHTPSQEAEAVFAAKTGVCEGYAKLVAALGAASGAEIAYVTGYIRDTERRTADIGSDEAIKSALEGYSHAWNAAKIDGQWFLVDATWDDPKNPRDPITSTYLFTPPELFVRDHLPESPAWQLLPSALSPGDFVRQPLLTPRAGVLGLVLEEPTRSQVTADGELAIILDDPQHARVEGTVRVDGATDEGADKDRCSTRPLSGTKIEIDCHLRAGQLEVRLFGGFEDKAASGMHAYRLDYVGSILVNSR